MENIHKNMNLKLVELIPRMISYPGTLTHLPECCIFVSVNQDSIGLDNGLSPIWCQTNI